MDQTIPLAARRSGPLKGPRPRARRQVDLAPLPDPRRAGGRRNPHHRPARGRGRHQYRQGDARARRHASSAPARAPGASTASASRASPRRPVRSISAMPAPAAAWSWARLRAARSPRPSTAMPRCARGRCSACSIRSGAWAHRPDAWPRAGACRSRSPARRTRCRSSISRRPPPRSSSPPCCSPASPRRARPW